MGLILNNRNQREIQIAALLQVPEVNVCMVGSTLICGTGNDEDFLVLIAENSSSLVRSGFNLDLKGQHYPSLFSSWRNGEVNVIATHDKAFFLSEVTIAEAARITHHTRMNPSDLSTRSGRVDFHSTIRNAVSVRMDASI